MMSQKGVFISFEGGEGAGKTTQINRLKLNLEQNGYEVIVTREPGGTPESEALWQIFIDNKGQNWDVLAQAFLVFTTRRLHTEELIKPALEQGKVVISDRYTDSTRVYQGIAGGLGLPKIERLREECIGEFEPDLTFIFDIDPQIGLSRLSGVERERDDTFEDKKLAFHQQLREGYQLLAESFIGRCHLIDAARSIEEIETEILDTCLKNLA